MVRTGSRVREAPATSLRIMLRITDTRTGHLVEIPAAPRRLLRSCVHLPALGAGTDDGTGIGPLHLRVPLIGDVLARTAELNGLQVITVLTTPELTPDRARALDRVMAVLGIHPPTVIGPHRPEAALGGPADVHVTAGDTDPGDLADGARVEVGRVDTTVPEQDTAAPGDSTAPADDTPAPADAADPADDTPDPLAVRLLLLGRPYGTPVTVTGAALAGAGRTLRDWRRSVADWAQQPSRPIPADLLGQSHAALAEDLDVAAVLALLAEVAGRSDVPAGAKFETFAHLDRVLGLDLARDVGHQRPTGP
ncbi:L-cysteine:1D-myo-inositol 2-amino-2-deoxy-alpha-D-glucopyranoside ligase [Streptomyces sp. ADI95-17]|nr:L-cysteine:1D-myo-inositol 2-amino-2-deoxy-alpha-D-glucopyranoside ligase [Streptomyces sp. ADI95-17]